MEAAKKTYHMACKEEKLAATREANGKTEASVTPDQQKKLHEKVDKCKQDVQKVRKKLIMHASYTNSHNYKHIKLQLIITEPQYYTAKMSGDCLQKTIRQLFK